MRYLKLFENNSEICKQYSQEILNVITPDIEKIQEILFQFFETIDNNVTKKKIIGNWLEIGSEKIPIQTLTNICNTRYDIGKKEIYLITNTIPRIIESEDPKIFYAIEFNYKHDIVDICEDISTSFSNNNIKFKFRYSDDRYTFYMEKVTEKSMFTTHKDYLSIIPKNIINDFDEFLNSKNFSHEDRNNLSKILKKGNWTN